MLVALVIWFVVVLYAADWLMERIQRDPYQLPPRRKRWTGRWE